MPEIGRQNLNNDKDYQSLFKDYKSSLPTCKESLEQVHEIFKAKARIALTCFEHDSSHCHRHIIRDYFKKTYSIETLDL
ncbi:MAG: DUF488 domain-containing protein [Treponema sp.]|jgi:uncharacterized protein (DUF488 family)|nr:DUF488 domain-containing protein [Treponema sp.]